MFLRVAVVLTFGLALILNSCASESSHAVLAKYGDQNITVKDFENAYVNNVGSYEVAKKDSLSKLRNFLDLYVDFQMKLQDAYAKGYDKDPVLQKELTDYKKKVGVSYLLDKELVDPAIHQLYERRKWEYRVSHIMFKEEKKSDLFTEKLANSVLDSIKNGASFEKLAAQYSKDLYSAKSGGDIFYATAGDLPKEFEDAFYSLEPGQVYPKVVHTRYGYHIIKVTDKRPRVTEVRASHIMAAYMSSPNSKPDTLAARTKMDSIVTELKAGVDFAKVAGKYSDDLATKPKGGDFGFITIRRIIKEITEPLFNLKNIGDLTPVIQTKYGFHILKLTGKKPYPAFDEDKDNLKKIYQTANYQLDYDTLATGLKNKYQYKLNDGTFGYLLANIDTGKVGDVNPKYDNVKDSTLFSFTGVNITVDDFLQRLQDKHEYANHKVSQDLFKDVLKKISNDVALEQEALNFDKTDPEFAALMTNYKNGIYIFKIQEDEVWNKVKIDSVKLSDYYTTTKNDYKWSDRVNYSEIFSRSDSAIKYYYSLLTKGAIFDSIAGKYTERMELKDKNGNWGLQEVSSSELASEANKLGKPGDYSMPIRNQEGYSILYLVAKDPAHLKTFDEAKAEVSSAYQETESKKLEKEYIDSLHNQYNPKIYYNELDQVFKSN
jgi:peptidyl-prolyl cis-trans isomerase SurA